MNLSLERKEQVTEEHTQYIVFLYKIQDKPHYTICLGRKYGSLSHRTASESLSAKSQDVSYWGPGRATQSGSYEGSKSIPGGGSVDICFIILL